MHSVSIYIILWYGLGRKEIVRGKGRKHRSTGLDLHCHLCATSLSALIPPSLSVAGSKCQAIQWKPSMGVLAYPYAGALPPTPPLHAARIWQHVLWSTFILSLAWSLLHGRVWFIRHDSGSTDLTNIQGNGKSWRRERENRREISSCMSRRWILEVDF